MSEDITFCYNEKCKNRKCERHISHIKKHYIPHSFAFFMDCKYWDMIADNPDIMPHTDKYDAIFEEDEQNG